MPILQCGGYQGDRFKAGRWQLFHPQKAPVRKLRKTFYHLWEAGNHASYGDKKGYVSKKYTKELGDTFVEVDISEQNLYLYVDDELYLTADVVTGRKNKYDTRLGCNPIYAKQTDRYLKGDDYNVHVDFWLPFDKGQGLHDASWRKTFDDDDYLNGSHGCVNMKYADAKTVYENVSVGTKVLVHK